MKHLIAASAWVIVLSMATPAYSQAIQNVLKVEHHVELCQSMGASEWEVRPGRLALAIVHESGMPSYAIDYANEDKTADGKIDAAEAVELIEKNAAALPGVVLGDMRIANALPFIARIKDSLLILLNRSSDIAGFKVSKTADHVTTKDFFNGRNVTIACELVPDSPLLDPTRTPTAAEDAGNKVPSKLASAILIRGKLEDLSIAKHNIKDSSSAKVAFRDNRSSDEQAFQVDAVVGLDFRELGAERNDWIPIFYTGYQLIENRGNDKEDIHYVSPGLLFDKLVRPAPWVSARIGLSPAATFDLKQGAETFKVKGYIDPAFRVGTNVFSGGGSDWWGRFVTGPISGCWRKAPTSSTMGRARHWRTTISIMALAAKRP